VLVRFAAVVEVDFAALQRVVGIFFLACWLVWQYALA
jgi:hypothetical protein